MKESPLIVPIQLESDAYKTVPPICCIQIDRNEIKFYTEVDNDVLKTILMEIMKNAG
ncbi:hypothetical protein T23_03990 [Turicibacter faecis]|jgi:hypothetical protein|uniref:Transposase n=1 Tax=Turicibacter faecis TaxID=2963365 RepID=A0ABN6ZG03_9FIRM|nr:hypothetical protein T23_03990 [Turicibacter sp. TC023]